MKYNSTASPMDRHKGQEETEVRGGGQKTSHAWIQSGHRHRQDIGGKLACQVSFGEILEATHEPNLRTSQGQLEKLNLSFIPEALRGNKDFLEGKLGDQTLYKILGSRVAARKALKESKVLSEQGNAETLHREVLLQAVSRQDEREQRQFSREMKKKPAMPKCYEASTSGPRDVIVENMVRNSRQTGELNLMGKKGFEYLFKFWCIPQSNGEFSFLTRLKLTNNGLETLPEGLHHALSGLKFLDLGQNRLSALPADLGEMKGLVELHLHYNLLRHLPDSVVLCSRLKELHVNANRLEVLPEDLGELRALQVLRVDDNLLDAIPFSITKARALQELNVSHNRLETLALNPIPYFDFENLESAKNNKAVLGQDWVMRKDEHGRPLYVNVKTHECRRHVKLSPPSLPPPRNADGRRLSRRISKPKTRRRSSMRRRYKSFTGEEDSETDSDSDSNDADKVSGRELSKVELLERKKKYARLKKHEFKTEFDVESGHLVFKSRISGETWPAGQIPHKMDKFGELSNLRVLQVNSNLLSALPSSIGHCQKLTKLEASFNKIIEIPPEFCKVKTLEVLNLANNRISNLPTNLGDLRKLTELGLENNHISTLPSSAGSCSNLRKLELAGNSIFQVPLVVGQLESLEEIRLGKNPLEFPWKALLKKDFPVKHIQWECKQRILQKVRGPPPPLLFVQNTGVQGEVQMLDHSQKKLVQEVLQEAATTKVANFHFKGLTRLPGSLKRLAPDLEELRCTGNVLTLFPNTGSIFELTKLKRLYCPANRIENLWGGDNKNWSSLLDLETLDLSENLIPAVPIQICKLRNLQNLFLAGNKLSFLPPSIAQLSQLVQLRVQCNALKELPAEITNLSKLEVLCANGNLLERVPAEIGKMSGLTTLLLSQNRLETIPDSLGRLPNLQTLKLAGNFIKYLPEAFCNANLMGCLHELNLQTNSIEELPVGFVNLHRLEILNLDLNPLRSPPPHYLNRGVPFVLKYLRDREKRIDGLRSLSVDNKVEFTGQFKPEALNVVKHAEIKEMRKSDLTELDSRVDAYVNGAIYLVKENERNKIVSWFLQLRKRRKRQLQHKVILKLIQVIEAALQMGALGATKGKCSFFDQSLASMRRFGEKNQMVECYALKADALFRDLDLDLEDSPSENSGLVHAVKHIVKFPYDLNQVLDAVRDFEGPYGAVGRVNVPFVFPGEDPELILGDKEYDSDDLSIDSSESDKEEEESEEEDDQPENEPRPGRKLMQTLKKIFRKPEPEPQHIVKAKKEKARIETEDGRNVIVIAKVIVTPKEARRKTEEFELIENIVEIEQEKAREWLASRHGQERIRKKAIGKRRGALKRLEDAKDHQIREAKKFEKERVKLDMVKKRQQAFDKGKDFYMHRFADAEDCQEEVEHAQAEFAKAANRYDEVSKTVLAKKDEAKEKLEGWKRICAQEMLKRVENHAREKVVQEKRLEAFENEWRRPWDGKHGADYEKWRFAKMKDLMDAQDDSDDEEEDDQGQDDLTETLDSETDLNLHVRDLDDQLEAKYDYALESTLSELEEEATS